MSTLEKQNYDIEIIENGFQLSYYMGARKTWAFKNWSELVDYLSDNPPKFYERNTDTSYSEIEYDEDTFEIKEDK